MYVGGLHLRRWESILDISFVVENLNKKGNKVEFQIFCPEYDKNQFINQFSEFKSTKFLGSISSSHVHNILSKADILIHAESFERNYIEYTKFSLSTKIPQYMAAGKPIIGYGPNILASIQHINNSKGGIIVGVRDLRQLENSLNELLVNKDLLISMSINSYTFAEKNHKKSDNLIKLKDTLLRYSKIY